jgi:O-acetyl-ADP-ribose deacetylase (regulator of RNase III)
VAIPAISCGAYGFPVPRACAIAWKTVAGFLAEHRLPDTVILTAFSSEVHSELLRQQPD